MVTRSLALWHGTMTPALPETVLAAVEHGWWNVMEHERFLAPTFDENDADQRGELDFELRTAYGNLVFETLLRSEDPSKRSLAEQSGLEGLGSQVGILFVTSDRNYGLFGLVCEFHAPIQSGPSAAYAANESAVLGRRTG